MEIRQFHWVAVQIGELFITNLNNRLISSVSCVEFLTDLHVVRQSVHPCFIFAVFFFVRMTSYRVTASNLNNDIGRFLSALRDELA